MAGWLGGIGGQSEAQAAAESALRNPVQREPGFWQNAVEATAESVMKGGAEAARTVMLAGSVYPQVVDLALRADGYSGKSLTQQYFEVVDPVISGAVEYWTPDQHTTGTAGRVLGGIAEFVVPLMAGGGNPLATAITTSAQATASTGAALAREDVSAAQVGGVAAVQGLANLAGVGIAMRGTTALRRSAFGAAANVAVNVPADVTSAAILAGTSQADRYNPWSGEARAIDVAVGALFGAMARPGAPPPKTVDVDATLTLKQVDHAQHDRAPGRIVDPVSARTQMENMGEAYRAIDTGTTPSFRPVATEPDPVKAQQMQVSRQALDNEIAQSVPPRDVEVSDTAARPLIDLPPEDDSAVSQSLRRFVDENPDFPVAAVEDPAEKGKIRYVTAREAMDMLESEGKADNELAGVFETAVNCFLRG